MKRLLVTLVALALAAGCAPPWTVRHWDVTMEVDTRAGPRSGHGVDETARESATICFTRWTAPAHRARRGDRGATAQRPAGRADSKVVSMASSASLVTPAMPSMRAATASATGCGPRSFSIRVRTNAPPASANRDSEGQAAEATAAGCGHVCSRKVRPITTTEPQEAAIFGTGTGIRTPVPWLRNAA